MNRSIRSKVGTAIGASVIVAATAVPALATVSYPGGGTWNYGVSSDQSQVWSNYHHPSRKHASSVINGYGEYKSSACKSAGSWAYASLRARSGHVDHSYWRYC